MLQLLHNIAVAMERADGILSESFEKKTDHPNLFVRSARPDSNVNNQSRETNLTSGHVGLQLCITKCAAAAVHNKQSV